MPAVRTLSQEQLQWRVYEVSTRSVPGAAAACCLIFDSEAIVRRCWVYPADWYGLTDAALWALLIAQSQPSRYPHAIGGAALSHPELPAAVAAAAVETVATSRALAVEARILVETNRAMRKLRQELLEGCQESRTALLSAVGKYMTSLKLSGATPELALVLVKEAIRDGLGGEAKSEEATGAALMGEGVAHAIKAYYAS